jgi:hypothetical protein
LTSLLLNSTAEGRVGMEAKAAPSRNNAGCNEIFMWRSIAHQLFMRNGDVLQAARRRQGLTPQTNCGHELVSDDRTSSAIPKFALVFPHGGTTKAEFAWTGLVSEGPW